jgi:hypothetical protein
MFEVYNDLLSHGYPPFGMKGIDVRKYFTSLAFVTKNNLDTETQLADTTAYFLNMQEREADKIETSLKKKEHDEVISVLKSKAFQYVEDLSGAPLESISRHC